MMRNYLRTELRPKPNLSLLLKQDVELLTKPSEELEKFIEEEKEQNPYIVQVIKKVPRWFLCGEERPKEVVARESLWEEIERQIRYELDGIDREIALEILRLCDSDGFLRESLRDIAEAYGVSEEYVEDIREFLMTEIEPVGIASRNIEEFIRVQLEEMYPKEKELHKKVMDALKRGKVDKEVKEILSHLRLKPLGEEAPIKAGSVDILLEYDGESWYILIKEDFFEVDINELAEAKDELSKEKLQRAKRIKMILEMRRSLLRGIGEAIISRQEGFLLRREPLRSLTIKEVAERLKVSISTISRIVNYKYAKTPAGTYPFRFFFVRESKEGVSREEVLSAIKEVLNTSGSLSDRKVCELLKERGIYLARRTVNKYRKLLGKR